MRGVEGNVHQPVVYILRTRARARARARAAARVGAGVAGALLLALAATATRHAFAAPPTSEPLGVVVEGLVGHGLVLQTTRGELIAVASDGSFLLPASGDEAAVGATPDGAFVYSAWRGRAGCAGVTVRTQPERPDQRCVVRPPSRRREGQSRLVVACAMLPDGGPEPDLSRFDSFQ